MNYNTIKYKIYNNYYKIKKFIKNTSSYFICVIKSRLNLNNQLQKYDNSSNNNLNYYNEEKNITIEISNKNIKSNNIVEWGWFIFIE